MVAVNGQINQYPAFKKKKSDPFAKKIPKTTKAIVLNADHIVSILKMVFNNGANFK